ncbi:serine/threonine-protein kinase mTOR-like isoform X1 [Cyprinus carpio]|uniref:Serine/threonine-protein kinase mTOR-like isoform X1 n=1 Tax=Cyprinus carpio TaxID=7962 RepID=A0A9R0A759_CYPCA|nr:serine/threonine-protein kinase mTOR-like isoform X1 [Cyprinus carpio]
MKLLMAIQLFGANLDDYLHLLLPPIVKLFDAPDVPLPARKLPLSYGSHRCSQKPTIGANTFSQHFTLWVALETLDRLTESLDFMDYASRIIHPIVQILDITPELQNTSMDTLSSLVFQLGKNLQSQSLV